MLLCKVLSYVDQYATDFSQLGVIALTLWLLLDWKERLVRLVVDLEKKDKVLPLTVYFTSRIHHKMPTLSSGTLSAGDPLREHST